MGNAILGQTYGPS